MAFVRPSSVAEVVENGFCIGCGLCASVTEGRVAMVMTARGSLRPAATDGFSAEEERVILQGCPGAEVCAPARETPMQDDIWGGFFSMRFGWAGDADVRFRAATGGVLTALAGFLLSSGAVRFVLMVAADEAAPMRSRWVMCESREEVLRAAGSRYGPVAPLEGFHAALARAERFALVAKPCDVSAIYNLAKFDARVDELCRFRLALVCGGQSRLSKSQAVLDEFGVREEEVSVFRYRGFGNPGRTRVETVDGRAFEKSYSEMWGDERGWELETRCKFCPDALGECADVAAADVWEGADPVGEDAGFNGVVTRSAAGEGLVAEAVRAGALVLGGKISPREFDGFQPHQVRKKVALAARFAGLADAGAPVPAADGLRVEELGGRLSEEEFEGERCGARRRALGGNREV